MNPSGWIISEAGFHREDIPPNGNKFLIGNGYMGVRGTLDCFEKEYLPAINLAGIYDKAADGWREPLNAPNALFTTVKADGVWRRLPECNCEEHRMELDFRHGIFRRETVWKTLGGIIKICSERFASMAEKHLLVQRYQIIADHPASIELLTGIDGDVWDIHGPHYDTMYFDADGDSLSAAAVSHEKQHLVCVYETTSFDGEAENTVVVHPLKAFRRFAFTAEAGRLYTLGKNIGIFTSLDCDGPAKCAERVSASAMQNGFDFLQNEHKKCWEDIWRYSVVLIEGDNDAMTAMNYSLYHLHSIAPRHSHCLSIPARGLSGQTYKGAIFWDTEIFMLDFFLNTEPETAKSLITYRIETLSGAKEKAAFYGFDGAFYAWESQEGGLDACTDYNVTDVFTGRPMRTYFRDKQVHISAAVVYGLISYIDHTGDFSLLEAGGAEVILECALFYYSLLTKKVCGSCYEIPDVIGPDEYHERVNNNAYTNRMVKFSFDKAIWLIDAIHDLSAETISFLNNKYDLAALKASFMDAAEKLYIPSPKDGSGLIEQFDGYFKLEDVGPETVRGRLLHEKEYWGGAYGVAAQTQTIKQADVVTMLCLFPDDYDDEICRKNWLYYDPRTEHGSSLSACMSAICACRFGFQEEAYRLFMKSACADLNGGGKEWAGLVYIGGTHPAAAGGAYKIIADGFAGLKFTGGKPQSKPKLPKHWKRLVFHVINHDVLYQVDISQDGSKIKEISRSF